MKKILVVLAVWIFSSPCFAQMDMKELFSNLAGYNKNHAVPPKPDLPTSADDGCSGFWGCLGHVCAVAGADIIGAAAGVKVVSGGIAAAGAATGGTGAIIAGAAVGVVCGAGASYQAQKSLSEAKNMSIPIPANASYSGLHIVLQGAFKDLSNVGISHNDVLVNNFYNGKSINEYYDNTVDEKYRFLFDSKEYETGFNLIQASGQHYAKSGLNFHSLTSELLKEQFLTENMKQVLDMFMEVYTTSNQPKDIENTVNFYIAEISNSGLSEVEKMSLLSAFMVASESPFYLSEK